MFRRKRRRARMRFAGGLSGLLSNIFYTIINQKTKIFIIIAVVGIVFSIKIALNNYINRSQYFKINNLKIVSNLGNNKKLNINLSDKIVMNETNIFAISVNSLAKYIKNKYPQLKNVAVTRILPDTLLIDAQVRIPIAQIKTDMSAASRYFPIDMEGVVIPGVRNFPNKKLPVITGVNATGKNIEIGRKFKSVLLKYSLDLLKAIKSTEILERYKLTLINVHDANNISFFIEETSTKEIIEVKIDTETFVTKLRMLVEVLKDFEQKNTFPKYVDLRFDDVIAGPR